MDAVPFVIAQKGADIAKPKEQYEMLRTFSQFLALARRGRNHPWRSQRPARHRYAVFRRRRRAIADDVQFRGEPASFLRSGERRFPAADKASMKTKPRPATAQWGQFLRNHDELDLGRLTEKQRDAVFAAFGPDPDMQLYGRGIRRRLAPMLQGDRRRLELAYSLMMTFPARP